MSECNCKAHDCNCHINYQWDLNKEKEMNVLEVFDSVKAQVTTTVSDSATVTTVSNAIEAEKAKVKACWDELVKRGKQSDAYKFVCRCIDALKAFLHKVLGHMKELYGRIVRALESITSKQIEMKF